MFELYPVSVLLGSDQRIRGEAERRGEYGEANPCSGHRVVGVVVWS